MGKTGLPRFGELDFLRGIAIVSMVAFHGLGDLSLLKRGRHLEGDLFNLWQQGTAILFLALFGIAAYLSYARNGSQKETRFRRRLRKGLILFGWGMIITLITYFFLRERCVVFGILHLMGVGSVLVYPLLPLRSYNLILGALIVLAGNYLSGLRFKFAWLAWLGLIPSGFNSIDYFPIAPWLGYILVGVFLGNLFYPGGEPRLNWTGFSSNPIVKTFSLLGRHSLLIYLVHQPLLVAIIGALIYRTEGNLLNCM